MKYMFGVVLVGLIILGGFFFWREVAEAPQQVQNEAGEELATTSPYTDGATATPASQGGTVITPLPASKPGNENVACTMDAMQCPDGSYVGRSGPDCAFAACPTAVATPAPDTVVCTDAMKKAEVCPAVYAPVCGLREVQCIKAPCNPIPETFSSGCNACAQQYVLSYTEGACAVQ